MIATISLAVVPAAVALWSLAAIHGPDLRRRLSAEHRHRADLRRVTAWPTDQGEAHRG